MILVLAWVEGEKDTQKLHVATDSLLTDKNGNSWQYGTKIFRLFPSIACIAYCGQSLGALHFVLQGTALISSTDHLLHHGNAKAPQLHARLLALRDQLDGTLKLLPENWGRDYTVVCGEYDSRNSRFALFVVTVSREGVSLNDYGDSPPLTHHGDFLAFGSGAEKATGLIELNNKPNAAGLYYF